MCVVVVVRCVMLDVRGRARVWCGGGVTCLMCVRVGVMLDMRVCVLVVCVPCLVCVCVCHVCVWWWWWGVCGCGCGCEWWWLCVLDMCGGGDGGGVHYA